MLQQEFGIAPEESPLDLIDRIRREEVGHSVRSDVRPWTNLPVAATQSVGRKPEIPQVRVLFDAGERLIMLVGIGGSGKTRLALQAAENLSGRFPDGIVFVSLTTATGEAQFVSATAEALGLPRTEDGLMDDVERPADSINGHRLPFHPRRSGGDRRGLGNATASRGRRCTGNRHQSGGAVAVL